MMMSGTSLTHSLRTILFLGVLVCLQAATEPLRAFAEYAAPDPHEALFNASPVPSAASCKTCHPIHYKEWSVSPHAYAVISPRQQRDASQAECPDQRDQR